MVKVTAYDFSTYGGLAGKVRNISADSIYDEAERRGLDCRFLIGVTGAFVFILWLFDQAVFQIGVLCPWCMLVWLMVIPMFWVLLFWSLKTQKLTDNARVQRFAAAVWPFTWVIVLANLVAIAVAILVQFPTLISLLLG